MHSWEGAYKGLAALSHELEVVRLGAGEREGAAAGRLLGGHFGVVLWPVECADRRRRCVCFRW